MSRMRVMGTGLLAIAIAVGAVGCSKDDAKKTENDRGAISFADPPTGSEALGLCYAYKINRMKDVIGGGNMFKRLAPEAIGKKGDKVTGEACSWARSEPNGDALTLRIEVRNFKQDQAALDQQYQALRNSTVGATSVVDIGDDAFSSQSKQTSLLQVRDGQYLLTLSSRAAGDLKPLKLDTLKLLAASGLEQLP
ncbi:MAG: hypothetical protein U0P45_03060 [Acidimicrobiales bacterium]